MIQNILAAVRPVLFDTKIVEFPYSFGGSLFIVAFRGRCYGLTCYHVTGDEGAEHIIVPKRQAPEVGDLPVPIEKLIRADAPDTDMRDVVVLCFPDDIDSTCFDGTAYNLTQDTIGTSGVGDLLRVIGCLNTKSFVDPTNKSISIGLGDLDFHALGSGASDPFLFQASAFFSNLGFTSLDGLSGAPVFNKTKGRLSGMVVRGNLDISGNAIIWFIDIYDIVKLVEAAHSGSLKLDYLKYPLR